MWTTASNATKQVTDYQFRRLSVDLGQEQILEEVVPCRDLDDFLGGMKPTPSPEMREYSRREIIWARLSGGSLDIVSVGMSATASTAWVRSIRRARAATFSPGSQPS